MGMICWLLGVSPAHIAAIDKTPLLASDLALAAADDARNEARASYLAAMTPEQRRAHEEKRRAAHQAFPEVERARQSMRDARERIAAVGPLERALNLGKSWHMLHYLMTGHGWESLLDVAAGDVASAPGDALMTGKSLGEDVGYGPARLHDARATADFARFLETQDVAALQARVNLQAMLAAHVYGMPMGPAGDAEYEAELRAEVARFFPLMRDYVVGFARKGYGLLIWVN